MTGVYGGSLFSQHQKLLAASAISPEVAFARGYRSVDTKAQLERLDIPKAHQLIPGLLIPVYGPESVDGEAATWQYRPDHPRIDVKGRPVKYVTALRGMHVDVPPAVRPVLGDPSRPLWVTEGVRKVDSAVSHGIDCIGVLGVWNWRGQNDQGGATALATWEYIALKGRDVLLCFDSDVMVKPSVRTALLRFAGFLEHRKASVQLVMLPNNGDAKTGLDDYLAAGGTVDDLERDGRMILPAELDGFIRNNTGPKPTPLPPPEKDGARLLDDVAEFIASFVVFPNEHALVASTLWTAHAHAVDCFESTPRIGFLAPEKECGKTRALEVLGLLTPNPMHAVNATPAALFRAVANKPTIMYDEIDTVFGPRAKENEEVRGLLNAGHRRSGVAYRCVGEGTKQEVVAFPAYAAVAFAGIGDLPDTIMSRTIVIPMRRRAAHETVESFRFRLQEPPGHALRDRLASWAASRAGDLTGSWPDIPTGVVDRSADMWEPLLSIADAAGGDWPTRARTACVSLVSAAAEAGAESLGVVLLRDLRGVFGDADAMSTEAILSALHELEESPWHDLRGKKLDARGLGNRLRKYGVRSKTVRVTDTLNLVPTERLLKGYRREDLHDSWSRYLPVFPGVKSDTSDTAVSPQVSAVHMDTDMDPDVSPPPDTHQPIDQPISTPVTCGDTAVSLVSDLPPRRKNGTDDAPKPRWDWS
jgi:hypothetical protein